MRLGDLHYLPRQNVSEASDPTAGGERLFQHDEVRLFAEVELAGWQLRGVEAKERSRRGPTCGDAPWQVRTDELESFAGRSLGGGMARFCLERFGQSAEDARLLSALMCLAPGMTQVGAAVSDSLEPSPLARPSGSGLSGPGPCYLLRAEGPLMSSIGVGGSVEGQD